MDKLEQLFDMQIMLQRKIGYDITKYNQEQFEKMILGCFIELNEILECTPWKPWKKSMLLNNNIQIEIIDLWHFVINISLQMGITPNILFTLYTKKHRINMQRQKNGY